MDRQVKLLNRTIVMIWCPVNETVTNSQVQTGDTILNGWVAAVHDCHVFNTTSACRSLWRTVHSHSVVLLESFQSSTSVVLLESFQSSTVLFGKREQNRQIWNSLTFTVETEQTLMLCYHIPYYLLLTQKWLEDSIRKVAKEWNELSRKEKAVSVH